MLSTLLSAAWWAARGAGVRAAVARFRSGSASQAAIAAVAVLVLAGVLALSWDGVKTAVNAARDSEWAASLARARLAAERREAGRDRAAEAAANAERARFEQERDAERARAAALAVELERLQSGSGDPVIYPRALVRRMRR